MSGRTLQQGLSRNPSRLLLISSPFLLVRFVIFCLLIYMSMTALVFAAWNVGASRAAGANVDGSSIFLIFNGIVISLSIAMALAGIKISSFSTSQVAFECAWTGIFTVLQIAASIFVTLSGPPSFCDAKTPLSICASTTILVPISWLAATLLLGYFVTILALCVSHLRVIPELWSTPIYDIEWFDDGRSKNTSAPQLPPLDTSPIHLTITPPLLQTQNDNGADVENQQLRADPNPTHEKSLPSTPNVWWDRIIPGRAGRDHPFAIRRPGERAVNHYYPSSNDWDRPRVIAATLPSYMPQYERGWQQQPQPQGEDESFGFSPRRTLDDSGPPAMEGVVLNEDEPIPMGDRSQWVRASQAPSSYTPPRPPRGARRKV